MSTTAPGSRVDLTRAECLELLRTQDVGRVILTLDALPVVVPVGYQLQDGGIVLRTHTDSRLVAAAVNAIVAFQVDDLGGVDGEGWSVTVTGAARPLEPTPERLVAVPDVRHAAERGADFLVEIHPTVVTGMVVRTALRSPVRAAG